LGKGHSEKWFRENKHKKTIFSTVSYDNHLLAIKGEVEKEPWKDLSLGATGWFYFCSKVTLAIENKGETHVNTDNRGEPITFELGDVKGTPNTIELLEKGPENPKLTMDVKDGKIVLEHVNINPSEPINLQFLVWFAVHVSEL